jgi:hypothetical protein
VAVVWRYGDFDANLAVRQDDQMNTWTPECQPSSAQLILAHFEMQFLMFSGRFELDTPLHVQPTDTNTLRTAATAMNNTLLVAETPHFASSNNLAVWNHITCLLDIFRVPEQ